MSEVKAVLLVPEPGDPHELLREGPCGARPPLAWVCRDFDGEVLAVEEAGPCDDEPLLPRYCSCALVLAWGGKPVAEGCFRASEGSRYLSYTSVRNIVDTVLRGKVHGDQPVLEERGTLVLLDADGREVIDD